jgi:Domain of unknown function (DUF3597)
MSIFSSIVSKIFPPSHPAAAGAAQKESPAASAAAPPSGAATASPARGSSSPAATARPPVVDVEEVLNGLAQKHQEKLNWRTSIVDLMKLLELDGSSSARKTLAQELHYTGDMNDSASMNIWLHKQVMKKLAENGGKVPDDLKD